MQFIGIRISHQSYADNRAVNLNQSKFKITHKPSDYDVIDLRNKVRESRQESLFKSLLLPLKRRLRAFWKSNDSFANITSCSELDSIFLERFLKIAHPYGITLSVDEIGSSCQIGQNSTIGASGKFQKFDEGSDGYKPRLGHLVKVNAGSIISGSVKIGNCVIISAGSIVTKDIPSFSIVRGVNEIYDLQDHHFKTFFHILYQQLIIEKLPIDGVLWKRGHYFRSNVFTEVNSLFKSKYPDIDREFVEFLKDKLS